jgi:hypothetical protein
VVLFSGGRGSGALTTQLVAKPRVALTVAINGYDDGASTGEVRRFLGDILKYRHRAVLGVISYIRSHVLSLLYLGLYGRYVSDTLSAARVVRTGDVLRVPCLLTDKLANQHLLSVLLRRNAEMLEVPVQLFSISPAQVKRTSPLDGLRVIATVLAGRSRRFDPGEVVTGATASDVAAPSSQHAQVP